MSIYHFIRSVHHGGRHRARRSSIVIVNIVFFKTPLNQEKPSPKVYKSSIQLFVHIHSNPLEPRIYQIYIYQIPDIVCIATLYFYRALTRTKISFTVIGEAYIFRGKGEARVSLGASLSLGEKKNGRALFLARGK